MTTIDDLNPLTIAELAKLDEYVDVWVLNTSQGETRGDVLFSITTSSGKDENVIVRASAAPLCLTEQVTKKQLLESSTFRRALSARLLTMIRDGDANSILAEPGMDKERERVRRLSIGTALDDAQKGMGREEEKETSNVSVPVQQFIDLMDTEEAEDQTSLMSLRNMGKLSLDEYRAVLRKCKALKFENTGKYVAAQIAILNKA